MKQFGGDGDISAWLILLLNSVYILLGAGFDGWRVKDYGGALVIGLYLIGMNPWGRYQGCFGGTGLFLFRKLVGLCP